MKKLNIIINSCEDCPYCIYNIGYDSGYDCSKTGDRIYNDNEASKFYKKDKEYLKSLSTLFPMDISEKPKAPWSIPQWCPLEDIKDDE